MDLTGETGETEAGAGAGAGAGVSIGASCGDGDGDGTGANSDTTASASASASGDARHAVDPFVNTCILCPHGHPASKPLASKGQACAVRADAWASVLALYPRARDVPVTWHTVDGCPLCRREKVHKTCCCCRCSSVLYFCLTPSPPPCAYIHTPHSIMYTV
jgi:hypothetical protein